jgi:hypothetical protein
MPKSKPKAVVREIALSAIHADERARPRAVSAEVVVIYREDMERGDQFPPPVVFKDEEDVYWLADGFHRFDAMTGRKTVRCEIHKGGLRDAILFACGANAVHGLRRTNEEKRLQSTLII